MRISDWSSDVCSSDLFGIAFEPVVRNGTGGRFDRFGECRQLVLGELPRGFLKRELILGQSEIHSASESWPASKWKPISRRAASVSSPYLTAIFGATLFAKATRTP